MSLGLGLIQLTGLSTVLRHLGSKLAASRVGGTMHVPRQYLHLHPLGLTCIHRFDP